jgi:hypothetical protein
MAAARWRQERVWTLETAAMDNQIRRPRYHEADEDFASQAYLAFHTLTNAGPSFELLNRYEVRHERQFRAALNTFLGLRAKRTVNERARKAAEAEDGPDWKPPVPTHTWDGEKRVPVCPAPEPEPTPEPINDDLAPAAAPGSNGKTAEPLENTEHQPACATPQNPLDANSGRNSSHRFRPIRYASVIKLGHAVGTSTRRRVKSWWSRSA